MREGLGPTQSHTDQRLALDLVHNTLLPTSVTSPLQLKCSAVRFILARDDSYFFIQLWLGGTAERVNEWLGRAALTAQQCCEGRRAGNVDVPVVWRHFALGLLSVQQQQSFAGEHALVVFW